MFGVTNQLSPSQIGWYFQDSKGSLLSIIRGEVAFHRSGFSSKQLFIKATFHQSGFSPKQLFIEAVFNQNSNRGGFSGT
jgi:hypothetical protein